jgi:hypothetical protein
MGRPGDLSEGVSRGLGSAGNIRSAGIADFCIAEAHLAVEIGGQSEIWPDGSLATPDAH